MNETKDGKQPSKRRHLLMIELGEDLRNRVQIMAAKNEMTMSAATRLLVRKALMSSKDPVITLTIPQEALLS
jgi:hypothetical protein